MRKTPFILDLIKASKRETIFMNTLMKLLCMYSLGANCILSAQTLSKDYPFLKSVDAIAQVSFSSSDGYFYYSYTLRNHASSVGKIEEFSMDLSRDQYTIEYDTVGLRFDTSNSDYEERSFRRNFPRLARYIIPIGLPNLPEHWGSVWGNQRSVSLSNVHDPVPPGGIADGFMVMSKGLPGIRRFIIEPEFQDALYFPSIEDTTFWKVPATKFIDSIRAAVNFHGWTIGPTAPPANFVPAVWLDTLISYKHQALALGWIVNKGIITSLDQKLENAKQQLQRGNASAAKNVLQAFVNEVEALNKQGNQVTSEAYAPLKFNAEYLISKL